MLKEPIILAELRDLGYCQVILNTETKRRIRVFNVSSMSATDHCDTEWHKKITVIKLNYY